jgi:hypothetical protein
MASTIRISSSFVRTVGRPFTELWASFTLSWSVDLGT